MLGHIAMGEPQKRWQDQVTALNTNKRQVHPLFSDSFCMHAKLR